MITYGSHGRIVGWGANALPEAGESCELGGCPRGLLSYGEQPAFTGYAANCEAVHAEVAALSMARAQGHDVLGATLWVTCRPCPGCAEAILAAGIRHVHVVSES